MHVYNTYTIKGETVAIHFGLPAVRMIHENAAKYPIQNEKGYYNNLGVAHIIYAGYLNACMIRQLVPTFEFTDFYIELEEGFFTQDQDNRWKEGINAVAIYSDSFVVKSLLEQEKKRLAKEMEEKEKPTTTKTRKRSSTKKTQNPTNPDTGTGSNNSVSASSA